MSTFLGMIVIEEESANAQVSVVKLRLYFNQCADIVTNAKRLCKTLNHF